MLLSLSFLCMITARQIWSSFVQEVSLIKDIGLWGEDRSQTRLCAVLSPVQLLYGQDFEGGHGDDWELHIKYTTPVWDCSSHVGTRPRWPPAFRLPSMQSTWPLLQTPGMRYSRSWMSSTELAPDRKWGEKTKVLNIGDPAKTIQPSHWKTRHLRK